MNRGEGKKIWLFPDGELPVPDKDSKLEAHEALMVLNTSDRDAVIKLKFYFEDREPEGDLEVTVPARRVRCIRMDHPNEIGGFILPHNKQYALRVESNVKITATFGRLDTTSEKMAFYSAAWYSY
ncbi:MAG: hypothetical protein JW770_02830 [Actinobacteria bacterium]|nr:hypothetical protein [Actinomycetota bacterium]